MRKKILIADDEPFILELIAVSLEGMPYEIIHASDGEEALRIIWEEHPDLVILDVMMPRKDGLEICRMIKADPQLSATPVILLSAKGNEENVKQGEEAGAMMYICKPFSPKQLLSVLNGLLKGE
ncbi:MAG: response regulator [bacterium]|nr:response regulator [bacterium]